MSTPSAVSDILNLVEDEDMFWIDDGLRVFWHIRRRWNSSVLTCTTLSTGIMFDAICDRNSFMCFDSSEHLDCCIQDTSLQCPYLVGPSDGDHTVIEQAASHADHCRTRTCKRRRTKDQDLANSCKITNPLFIPSSGVFAEVIVV